MFGVSHQRKNFIGLRCGRWKKLKQIISDIKVRSWFNEHTSDKYVREPSWFAFYFYLSFLTKSVNREG